jgi:hypothetical protein
MGHLVVFNTWGYIVTFGVFQAYYESTLGVSASENAPTKKMRNTCTDPTHEIADAETPSVDS